MWYARRDFTEGSLFVLPDYTPQTLPFLIPVVSPAGIRLALSAADNGDGTGALKAAPIGLGGLFAIPQGTTNGTSLGAAPLGSQGVRMYVPAGVTLTYTIAAAAPTSAPANTVSIANPTGAVTMFVDENLAAGQNVYVTAPLAVSTPGLVARFM